MDAPTDAQPETRRWYRNRFVWFAAILVLASTTAVALVNTVGASPDRGNELRGQLTARMLTILEEVDPDQHHGHGEHVNQETAAKAAVICGAQVYGFDPADATALPDVQRVYGFHLCGIAEPNRPWDWAVKLVGPVILEMTTEPPTVHVAEATGTLSFRDRVMEMFPPEYHEEALGESLDPEAMQELRRRYDSAAGL